LYFFGLNNQISKSLKAPEQKKNKIRGPVGLSADSNHESRILDFGSFSILYIYFFGFLDLVTLKPKFFTIPNPSESFTASVLTKKTGFC
jgi:hypothetical protein